MLLTELMAVLTRAGVDHALVGRAEGVDIAGLTCDSRRVGPGALFAALAGATADGHDFLPQAAAAGAAAALVQRADPGLTGLAQVLVPDARRALALLAHEFHGRPTRGMTLVGITGTNGKTTISYLIESVLKTRGPVGVIGTVEARWAGVRRPAAMTTPESVDLMAMLADMRAAGVEQAVMEVSSHALAQRRADGCLFDLGLFTNLSRDHLDYHRDLDDYFAAKRRLFAELLPASREAGKEPTAVICLDDPRAQELRALCLGQGIKTLTYGLTPAAQVHARDERTGLTGGQCTVVWPGGDFAARTALVGGYNLQNLLAAAAAGLALGLEPAAVAAGIEALGGVPGRLERAPAPEGLAGPAVFVDYAHTDDALDHALAALKALTPGRLICVFGAGGDRDHGKRPLMGRAAGAGADLAVLTSDNPRTENPLAIMAMIEPGLRYAGMRRAARLDQAPSRAYVVEPDRAVAIALAVGQASENDVILIAGKGHEDYQIVGRSKHRFDDREQAAAALALRARRGGGGAHAQAGR